MYCPKCKDDVPAHADCIFCGTPTKMGKVQKAYLKNPPKRTETPPAEEKDEQGQGEESS